jgi:hypothetical protein
MWDRSYWQTYAKSLYPRAILVYKSDYKWLFVAIGWLLFFWSGKRRHAFIYDYAQTIGPVQFYGDRDNLSYGFVAHECRHSTQSEFLGWFVPVLGWIHPGIRVWVGLLPMFILYCLLPLPVVLAYFRYRLELDADIAGWRQARIHGVPSSSIVANAQARAEKVASWAYLRSWPYSLVLRGYQKASQKFLS